MKEGLDIVIYVCGLIASLSTAVTIIIKYIKKHLASATREVLKEEMHNYTDSFTQKLEDLNAQLQEYITEQKDTNKTVKHALLASTRERINEAHVYCMSKGFIGAHTLFVMEELYNSYKELGGNSFIDRQMKDIKELEVKSAEDKK